MALTPYQRGYNFERRVQRHLESQGWYVQPSRGSKKVDLIAARAGEIMAIECKVDAQISHDEEQYVVAVAEQFGGIPMLAYREGKRLRFRDIE
jgi:Holliday junction resolvase